MTGTAPQEAQADPKTSDEDAGTGNGPKSSAFPNAVLSSSSSVDLAPVPQTEGEDK